MTDLPLSARVDAPTQISLPEDGDGLTWRAATMDDIDAILDCETAIGAADHPHYRTARDEIVDDFEASYVDIESDTLIAVDDAGVVQAWGIAILSPGQETLVRSILAGGVRPSSRGRGIGRRLLQWQQQRGMQQLATSPKTLPGRLLTGIDDRAQATRRLLERAGFSAARYYLELGRDLSQPIAALPDPSGVTIERFSEARAAATLVARNDSFRDHWGSQPVTEEQWSTFLARENFRPDWSFVAVSGDEVVGFTMCDANTQDWELQGFTSGYVDLVGTTRDWRKRGIAAAVLTRTIEAAAADGITRLVLDVDSDSPTGAVGLYSRLGFVESNRSVNYVREF